MKDARYMDVSGAMALLNFIEQSDKSGLNVTLEQVPVHIKKTLVTMASNEQKDKLLFAEVDVIRKCPRMRAMQMEDMLRLELMQNIQVIVLMYGSLMVW